MYHKHISQQTHIIINQIHIIFKTHNLVRQNVPNMRSVSDPDIIIPISNHVNAQCALFTVYIINILYHYKVPEVYVFHTKVMAYLLGPQTCNYIYYNLM